MYQRVAAASDRCASSGPATLEQRGVVETHAAADALVQQQLHDARGGARRRSSRSEDLVEPVPTDAAAGRGAAACRPPSPLDRLQRSERRRCSSVRAASPGTGSSSAAASGAGPCSTTPGERTIDWATAEELAFATILEDGIADPPHRRGRRARHVQPAPRRLPRRRDRRASTCRCRRIPQARAAFEIHNSPLSELAAIGFEFGYNVQEPGRLVLWEAQYGDFINGAQIMIDEFVTSARAKWGQTPSLVFLLPHGYEGQGPDHSSARPERFLQAAADINLRLANCTTAAQYFHLLRRQALLLADRSAAADRADAQEPAAPSRLCRRRRRSWPKGRFQPVIDDGEAATRAQSDRRVLVLCSGKVYVDLVTSERARRSTPRWRSCASSSSTRSPTRSSTRCSSGYREAERGRLAAGRARQHGRVGVRAPAARGTRWADALPLRYVGRPRSASPSEGSAAWHAVNQRALVEQAFTGALDAHGSRGRSSRIAEH